MLLFWRLILEMVEGPPYSFFRFMSVSMPGFFLRYPGSLIETKKYKKKQVT